MQLSASLESQRQSNHTVFNVCQQTGLVHTLVHTHTHTHNALELKSLLRFLTKNVRKRLVLQQIITLQQLSRISAVSFKANK